MRKSSVLRLQAARRAAKTAPQPDHVARIDALTRNARSTWSGLLAALVFVGVTLAGVEHIDFYGVNRATQLPLVNVSVPTRLFFLAAPVLTAAIYIYFHLYLIRLFDALGAAQARVDGEPLSQAIAPWLINDAVLWVRRRNRDDDCHPERRLEHLSAIFNILLAWFFGLGVLGWSWYAALPARDFLMNAVGAVSFCLAFSFAVASYVTLRETALVLSDGQTRRLRRTGSALTVLSVFGLAAMSFAFAHPTSPWLARVDLTGEEIVDKPDGWLPHQIARRDFLDVWRKREGLTGKDLSKRNNTKFQEEWQQRRNLALADLERPDFDGKGRGILLNEAYIPRAFLSGLDLSDAQMRGAILWGAQMEGANFSKALMEEVDLWGAQINGANFSEAVMDGANLVAAQMEGADFGGAEMDGAYLITAQMKGANLSVAEMELVDLWGAQMKGANFSGAQMGGADLRGAQMEGANFTGVQLVGADLRGAQLEGADLTLAQMVGADLSFSMLNGGTDSINALRSTNLIAATNFGGALRYVDLSSIVFDSKTDFRNAFMDGSVETSSDFETRLGEQCQNLVDPAKDDAEFFAHWRGWVEHESNPDAFPGLWQNIAPPEFLNVEAKSPPPGCVWKTGPMPE